ncbi:MAG TPA: phage head closure protein [Firmicutes bacterium]|nr:phage head closure protein [Bacillota bacterium]
MSLRQLLNQTVSIQRKERSPDGMGGWISDWVTVITTVARISPVSAKERIQYEQLQYPVTHKVYMLGSANVKPGDQIVFGARRFSVKGVTNPSEMGHHLEVLCEETGI